MQQRIGITFFLLLTFLRVSSQQSLNYADVDARTYQMYLDKQWNSLIDLASEARSQGISFFYLNVRTGIAWYNLKKYRKASKWFLKEWENGKTFDWYQEYLYYSLLFSGRYIEAVKISNEFSDQVKKKIGFATKKLTRLALEGGYCFNPDFSSFTSSSLKEEAETGNNYGEAFYLKNYHFESLDLSHQIIPGLNLNHNFTFIGVNREEQVDWGNLSTFPIQINQFQYYLNPYFVLGRKLNFSPSFNIIWGKSDLWLGGLTAGSERYFYSSPLNYSDIIFSASAWMHFGNVSPGGEFNSADINDKKFIQFSAWLTLYPFSNVNFYLTPRVYFKNDSENGFGYNTFGLSGGLQLGKMHFSGQYLKGDLKNFVEPAGYVIANFPGRSTRKYTGSINFPTGKKYQFVIRYLNQDVIETYQVYVNGVRNNNVEYSFIKHTFTAGISWYF